ncbi:MAG: cAMP-binding protein, partial [Spirochaetaceae bacterium]|nr:cAMP-binding protein [Spirochaetaceae bacterium]
PKELISMVGLPTNDGNLVVHKLLENNKLRLVENKITALDLLEIEKQTEYYRKMQKIERARKEAQAAR